MQVTNGINSFFPEEMGNGQAVPKRQKEKCKKLSGTCERKRPEEKSMHRVPEKGKKGRKNHLSHIFGGDFIRDSTEKIHIQRKLKHMPETRF